MRVPLSWLRDHVDLSPQVRAGELAARLTDLGLKLESLTATGAGLQGPLVVGRVLTVTPETHRNGKTVRWCSVDVGEAHNDPAGSRGILCGAANFAAGDLVVVSLPGAVLPGDFRIAARKTYGHLSDGMICSARELGVGDDAEGIIVLRPGEAAPGDDAGSLLGLREEVIELEITPDRAYALSIRGVAREAALACGVAFRDPASVRVDTGPGPSYPVAVDDAEACPVFVIRMVSGFDPAAPTPRRLARRLQLAGMRPISLPVDITNYVMLELGQPIHGYDRDRLQGPIRVRRADRGERLRTLDGHDRALDAEDLLITDDRGPVGLAGVMGGESTEICASTSAVVIEAAHFAPVPVARAARRHRLVSEASRRFERGVDPQLPMAAAQRVADLLVELGGGTIEPGVTVVGTYPHPEVIRLDARLPERVSGAAISPDSAIAALRAVGCCTGPPERDPLDVTPPTWRPDLTDPYDLVEEVVRVVGYDTVPSVLPAPPPGRGLTWSQRLRRRVGLALAGAGYTEVVAYPFVGAADFTALGLASDDPRRSAITVANPLTAHEPLLHTTLAPALLHAMARNVGRGSASVALCLVAPVFLPGSNRLPAAPLPPADRPPSAQELTALDAALPAQPRHLAVLLSGERTPAGWWGPARAASWADAVAAVRLVARVLGVPIEIRPAETPPWHPGRCGQVLVDGVGIGFAGELHPRVCTAYGVPPRSAFAEVDLDALIAQAPTIRPAPRFSTMPVAKADVALVVDASVPAARVEAALVDGAGPLLESIHLFDVYIGASVPTGKKSLAFALRFRDPSRTLTEQDTAAAREAAVSAAAEATGAVPRS
ncbi:MAG: phenylalanine--tRNA ligase subunit beta [Nocardioidaceae bacterium]